MIKSLAQSLRANVDYEGDDPEGDDPTTRFIMRLCKNTTKEQGDLFYSTESQLTESKPKEIRKSPEKIVTFKRYDVFGSMMILNKVSNRVYKVECMACNKSYRTTLDILRWYKCPLCKCQRSATDRKICGDKSSYTREVNY